MTAPCKRSDALLPVDWQNAVLIGRVQVEDDQPGPRPFLFRDGSLIDLSHEGATVSDLLEIDGLVARLANIDGENLGPLDGARLLAPCDLQAIKAAGVTFARSALERVVEERSAGAPARAEELRAQLSQILGGSLNGIVPGSPQAASAKAVLENEGLWSQYLEVAIGPDPEIFTKAQPMSAVGPDAPIGIRSDSNWNNPEPEMVLAINSSGIPVGATLGNDVNLRDFEGRSALLLGTAKDNTSSCAIGPFVRLFDKHFTLADVKTADIRLKIEGHDGFDLEATYGMEDMSRDPAHLVHSVFGAHHQYPDGVMLFLGTGFAPTDDRGEPGMGFAHRAGDWVTISSPQIGTLENFVVSTRDAPRWTFGVRQLMLSLASRGIL